MEAKAKLRALIFLAPRSDGAQEARALLDTLSATAGALAHGQPRAGR